VSRRNVLAAAKDRYQRGLMDETLTMIERGLMWAREVPAISRCKWLCTVMMQGQAGCADYEQSSQPDGIDVMRELPETDMLEEKVTVARAGKRLQPGAL
jgi:hypothetical protein